MNCTKCGAPLDAQDEVCQYCGTRTPYGERLLEERRRHDEEEARLHALDNMPAMKHVSMAFAVFLQVITLGGYAPYWYATRIQSLNALGTSKKFPAWLAGVFALAWCAMILLPNGEDIEGSELFNYAAGIAFVASVYLAFSVRSILQEYASRFMERNIAVATVAPSGVLLVLFGPLYLQACVNRLIKMKFLAPKI